MLNFLSSVVAYTIGFLPRMRLSKAVSILALCLATAALAAVFPLDFAFLMAGDWALYFEVLTAIGLVSVSAHARSALRAMADAATRTVRQGIRRISIGTHSIATAVSRSRRSPRKPVRSRDADEEGDAGVGWAFA